MIGCPGSGKSTYAEKMLNDGLNAGFNIRSVSRDTIRFSLIENGDEYFSKEKEVFNIFIQQIKMFLNQDGDVIADATHISYLSRAKLFDALDIDREKTRVVAVDMRTPLDICLERNENRKGTRSYVPRDQVRRMYYSYKEPDYWEYNSIFSTIIKVYPNKTVFL